MGKIIQKFLTQNDCYKAGKNLVVKGLMLHSTGANNPKLSRYVGPDDGILGVNPNGNHWNQPRPDGRQVCVHGFIGKDKNGEVRTYQTLPWNYCGWHCAGSGNNTHIGVELCEDDLKDPVYFAAVYKEAVELFAFLCKLCNLTDKDILDHSEGYKKGIASNHGDVTNWFSKQGKTMNMFRSDVANVLNGTKNGWKKENEIWYYYDNNVKKTGWIKDAGKWYYLNPHGDMRVGWVQDGDKWYFLAPNGEMKTGWIQTKNKWYYLKEDGSMATGRYPVNGKWYFLQSDGALLITDKDGAIING